MVTANSGERKSLLCGAGGLGDSFGSNLGIAEAGRSEQRIEAIERTEKRKAEKNENPESPLFDFCRISLPYLSVITAGKYRR
jgi:hypothetical protein